MAVSDATLRDLQYMLDGHSPQGEPFRAIAEALLDLLDRAGVTDTSTGTRTARSEPT